MLLELTSLDQVQDPEQLMRTIRTSLVNEQVLEGQVQITQTFSEMAQEILQVMRFNQTSLGKIPDLELHMQITLTSSAMGRDKEL